MEESPVATTVGEGSAGGQADGIVYRLDRSVDPAAVASVYRSVGWERLARDTARLGQALQACSEVATAWDGDEAVGVARLLTDGVFQGVILGVAVRPSHQGRGIGSRLVESLISLNPNLRYHLWTHSRRFSFYERLGFRREETAMERPAPQVHPEPASQPDGTT